MYVYYRKDTKEIVTASTTLIEIEECDYFKTTKAEYEKTFECPDNYRWCYVDGQIVLKEFTETLSSDQLIHYLRCLREDKCFPIINRGRLWYASLSDEQTQELSEWYQDWLNVTETLVEPTQPEWLK